MHASGETAERHSLLSGPVRVRFRVDMVARLKRTVLRAARAAPGKQTGGALLGTAIEDASGALVLDVSDFSVLPSVHGPDHDYTPPVEQIRSLGGTRDVRAIGYFRTQGDPDLGLRSDETVLAREFRGGAAIALLLAPGDDGRVLAGVIHSDGVEFHNTPAKRFQFDEAAFGPLRPVVMPSPTAAGGAPARNGRRFIVAAVVGVAALLAGAVGAYWWSGEPGSKRAVLHTGPARPDISTASASTPAQGIDLAVTRAPGGLMVSWIGAAVNATGGQLIITDGDLPSEIVPLTADDIHKGKIFYRTNSERLRFRVELVDPGSRRWSDSLLVLGGSQAAAYSSASERRNRDTAARSVDTEPPPSSSDSTPVESRSEAPANSALRQPAPAPQPRQVVSGRTFQPPRQQAAAPVERTVILDAPSPMPVGAPALRIAQGQPAVPVPPVRPPADAPVAQNPAAQNPAVQTPSSLVPSTQPAASAAQPRTAAARQYTGPVAISQFTPRLEPAIRSILVNDVEVEVKVQIDASGRVVRAEPLQKLTGLYEHVERAAVDAAERWRFQPATINGKTVPSVQTIKFLFRK